MIPKCVILKRGQRPNGCGAFGRYYRLSKVIGIKVLSGMWSNEYCTTQKELKASNQWKEAVREARLIRVARKSRIVPKCYGVVPVRREGQNGRLHVGIVMQHIPGRVLGNREPDVIERLSDRICNKCKLSMQDLHGWNILVTGKSRKRYWVIDFTPDLIDDLRR